MKRAFFLVCCILVFGYVSTSLVAEQRVNGIMNAPLHMQNYDRNKLHQGIDVFWSFAPSPWPSPSGSASVLVLPPRPELSERPYLLAYSDGAMLLNAEAFCTSSFNNPINAGADMCINPRSTVTVIGSQTVYCVLEDPQYMFGAGHCDWDLGAETDTFVFGERTFLSAKENSKLAGLQANVRDAYLYWYASARATACWNSLPSGAYVTYGSKILVPGINAGDKIAIMGDWWGGTSAQDHLHFHMRMYCINGGEIENIGAGNQLAYYLHSIFTSNLAPSPNISIGRFLIRENWRDWVCGVTPEAFAGGTPCMSSGAPSWTPAGGTVWDQYVALGDATPTPSLGFPGPSPLVVVYRDVDFLEDAARVQGYKFTDFDRIELWINRIDRVQVTPSGMAETCAPSKVNMVHATPYKTPVVLWTDRSYGVTFPPYMPTNTNIIAPNGLNGDYGYVFEMDTTDGSYLGGTPSSWQNNPYTVEGGYSERFGAYWILTNLHGQYSPCHEFRFDSRDRYHCWNSNVHLAYTPVPAAGVAWWLPPKHEMRVFPTQYSNSGAPPRVPASPTNNMAYHPDYAYFPDGRYNVETKYFQLRGEDRSHETADFYVDNFKPFVKYVSVQQQQLNWDRSSAWLDPDVEGDWLPLTSTSTVEFTPYSGSTKKYRSEYLAYLAYWKVKPGTGAEAGQDAFIELNTHNSQGDRSSPYLNWTASGRSPADCTAKKWVHGRKPLYIELEFSEAIDETTFCFDLEDRFGNFRQMIAPGQQPTHQIPSTVTNDSEIFEYFDLSDDCELGWCFKRGSGNKIVFLKIPALRLYLRYDTNTQRYEQSALFDSAERRMFIYAKDETGTPLACLEPTLTDPPRSDPPTPRDVSCDCDEVICRNYAGVFNSASGDGWIHRLSIDTVTEARVWKHRSEQNNWDAVAAQIGKLERNEEYINIQNWHQAFDGGEVWTEDWDPKRSIQRQSLDGTWIADSAGSRETRTIIGSLVVDDRIDANFPRIMAGRAVSVEHLLYGVVIFVESYTVDSIGNKDAAFACLRRPETPPESTQPPTTLPVTFRTYPPSESLPYRTTSAPVSTPASLDPPPTPESTLTYVPPPTPTPSLSLEGLRGGGEEGEDNPTD
ncbi:MAG: hypothetical protein WC712_05785 [Candidatus Brocadiia bacterium]